MSVTEVDTQVQKLSKEHRELLNAFLLDTRNSYRKRFTQGLTPKEIDKQWRSIDQQAYQLYDQNLNSLTRQWLKGYGYL